MTLGDIIKEYLEDHTVNEFLTDSGISKAYTYNLINNKGTSGSAPTPTIETINKVARGVHSDFDTIFNKLDKDIIVSTNLSRPHAATQKEAETRRMTSLYNMSESSDGSIHIVPKPEIRKYIALLTEDSIRKLLDAASHCSNNQIIAAINVLNAFKNNSSHIPSMHDYKDDIQG